MITADLYLRLSDPAEEALDGREARLRAEAARLGWGVHQVIIENDTDADGHPLPASAYKRSKFVTPTGTTLRTVRPRFASMLANLISGRANAVLAEDLDRTMRQPRDGEDLLDACELSGATARSLSGSLTLTAGGTDSERFMARILVASANKSSADTARRVAAARERLAGQSYGGGRRPYGYRVDPDSVMYHRTLTVDQAEAAVITEAAAAILDRGVSLKAAARDLRDRGVPTVTGAPWAASTLRDVLSKPAVAGLAAHKGELHPAPWPAILDRDVYDRLRDLFDGRKNPGTSNAPRWLLSCYATCGVCGGPVKCTGSSQRRAYTCTEGGHVRRNAVAVDELVSARVIALIERDAADLLRPAPRTGTDAGALRAELRRLRDRKAALSRMFAADGDEAALASGLRVIRDRMAKAESELAASDQPDPLPEFRGEADALDVWDGLGIARQRAVARLLYDVVILPAGRTGNRFDPDSVQVVRKAN